jgi:hypothetical protein
MKLFRTPKKSPLSIFFLISVFFLNACGGGSNNSSQPISFDNYAGIWHSECYPFRGTLGYFKFSLTMSLASPSDLSFSQVDNFYSNSACNGTPTAKLVYPLGNFRLDSRDTVESQAFDKFSSTRPSGTLIHSGSTYLSNVGSPSGTLICITFPGLAGFQCINEKTETINDKDVFKILTPTSFEAASAPLDEAGYPTSFDGTVIFTKE